MPVHWHSSVAIHHVGVTFVADFKACDVLTAVNVPVRLAWQLLQRLLALRCQ